MLGEVPLHFTSFYQAWGLTARATKVHHDKAVLQIARKSKALFVRRDITLNHKDGSLSLQIVGKNSITKSYWISMSVSIGDCRLTPSGRHTQNPNRNLLTVIWIFQWSKTEKISILFRKKFPYCKPLSAHNFFVYNFSSLVNSAKFTRNAHKQPQHLVCPPTTCPSYFTNFQVSPKLTFKVTSIFPYSSWGEICGSAEGKAIPMHSNNLRRAVFAWMARGRCYTVSALL